MGSDKPHEKLGDRIRKLLDNSNISQRELARRLDVGPNQVSRWILGGVAPTYTVLNDILKICRSPLEAGWLLTGKEGKKQTASSSQSEGSTLKTEEEQEAMKDLIISLQSKVITLKETIEERDKQIAELLNQKKAKSIKHHN